MRRVALLLATLALAACGKRETLRPAMGEALPQKPAMAAVQPDADALLTPGPQARPVRSEELLRKSQPRGDDRFNLPPRD